MSQPLQPSFVNPHAAALGAAYPVTLPAFQGPLDLLLHLIEQEELDISAISLVAVTDQYLRTLEQLEAVIPGALADFLVIATRLLYLKSNSLLPKPASLDDEDEESADALVRQLLEYRRFKQAATGLRSREEGGVRVFVRATPAPELDGRTPRLVDFDGADLPRLHAALRKALARIPVEAPPPPVHPYTVTVAEQIEVVRRALASLSVGAPHPAYAPQGIAFTALLAQATTRIEVVVTFLAVLELLKQAEIVVLQEATFGDILLYPAHAGNLAAPSE